MNIEESTYKTLLSEGLCLDHYYILVCLRDGIPLPRHSRIQGFVNLLHKKEYLIDDVPSDKAIALIKPKKDENWVANLLASLKTRLKERIGKEQKMGFGNTYFIPGYNDLANAFERFEKQYKMTEGNYEKIEKILLAHVDKCCDENNFAPSIQYFIIKERPLHSRLAAALENYEETEDKPQYESKVI